MPSDGSLQSGRSRRLGWAGDITIAQALKPLGYATGQFGKNHLGDRDEYLPTNHGFDEFYGNLYHPNAGEERKHLTGRRTTRHF